MSEDTIKLITETLDECAEAVGDIMEPVYARFIARCPEAEPLMGHSDAGMKGRMLAQVIELLLSNEHLGQDGYLRWEVDNHLLAYGVTADMYATFLQALQETVQESLGDQWDLNLENAWSTRVARLLTDIHAEAAAHA